MYCSEDLLSARGRPSTVCFEPLQLEALNGSSLSEAVSHIKVKYAGKDRGTEGVHDVSRVGVMCLFCLVEVGVKIQLDL